MIYLYRLSWDNGSPSSLAGVSHVHCHGHESLKAESHDNIQVQAINIYRHHYQLLLCVFGFRFIARHSC